MLPVRETLYVGKGSEIAICTLGSMDLLRQISRSALMDRICIAGRLLSENAGIDQMLRSAQAQRDLRTLIVCGREVQGHMPGQALVSLFQNGIDKDGRIIGAEGHRPVLSMERSEVKEIVERIELVDLIGEVDYETIARSVP
ncbi:MAG: tetrahydromethanopterin S-methyltransferase subunit A [Nitrososphaera sp.]